MANLLINQGVGFIIQQYFNPFTPSSGQSKNSRKILNLIFSNPTKQMVPCESTAGEVSFDWSHYRISSTDSKVRTTINVSITDSGSERVKIRYSFGGLHISVNRTFALVSS